MTTDPDGRAVLVTGGAGFIGSHVVEQLIDHGYDVIVIDSLDPAAHDGPPPWCDPRAEWRWADVTDPAVWREVLPRCSAVCHLAAKVGLGVDFGDAAAYVHNNDVGTVTGLQAMHALRWRGRLVLSSSMVVYGEGAYRCAQHGPVRPGPRRVEDLDAGRYEPPCPHCGSALTPELVTEDAPVDPRNVYAATKLHQEHLSAAFAREHPDVAVTALRYHNVYGPRMPFDTPYAGVASLFRSRLANGEPPRVFEDGGQRRDFVHVADVAAANRLAVTAVEPVDGVFNIASGHPATLLEMAEALCAAHGGGLRPEVTGGYRLGDVRHVTASIARAEAVLGYRPSIGLLDGMAEFARAPQRRAPVSR
ncbi:MAG: NAD-dependent epimerase/dehydratase family protein [Acidimicrobiales bacterium]|nr:NAD-dependent epimerase/dehydratase family protein [Acidimicrobiales bacterium]